ncbi:hypothetical protein [Sphingobacterium tabacisoli]|uniref:Uncharacterized protein n=1 Tax=Sphingobacterium tabacisoli TaxID=2044855 RepID=A0ABW5L1D7_9SPHI|nr:hypothetical protein [Sphingobacterium tabacisoli]
MSTNINVELNCATCGQSNFDHNEDKSWVKCNNCDREYLGGISELAEFNQSNIQDAVNDYGQSLVDEFAKSLESKFKNNKYIKFKRK